jgi:MFS family permease
LRRVSEIQGLPRGLVHLFIVNVVVSQNQSILTSLLGLLAESKGATQLDVGLLFLLGGVSSTLLMIPSGVLSQMVGRRRMIMIGAGISAVSLLSLTMAPTWNWLIPGASGFNIGFALFIPARMSLIADYSTQKNRATVYGLSNISWPVGTIYGPVAAGALADSLGWNSAFYFASLTEVIAFYFATRLDKDQPTMSTETSKTDHRVLSGLDLFKGPAVPLYAMHLLNSLGVSTVDPLLPLYLQGRFGINRTGVGLFYSISAGFSTLIGQVPAGIVGDRYGNRKVILAGLAALPPLYMLCGFSSTYLMVLVFYVGVQAMWSLTWPTSMALLIGKVPNARRGLAVGIRQTVIRLGADFGPTIGGTLAPFPLPFFAAAIINAASILPILRIREKNR